MKIIKWSLLLGLSITSALSWGLTQASDVKSFTLKNGMQVFVLEDNSIPNANMYLFWKVGSRNEYPGITGLSHFFEHMMFNGAKKYGFKQFDRAMEAAGGANNAYTTENSTVYTDWFPAESLELMFDLEADRISNLSFDPEVVESERGVVTSERSTGLENSNYRALSEEVKGAAFRAHPYSWPVIGHASDIAAWTMEDLQQYHKTYYAPNNAIVVVTGAVKLAEVKRLAMQYFEPIPAQTPPKEVRTVEPEQKGERRVYLSKESVSTPNVLFAYHVPESKNPDYYALIMLSDILSAGNSSRLKKSLMFDKQLATQLFSYIPDSIDPNLFYIYAVAAADVAEDKLEQGVIEQVNLIMQEGVTEEELQKVKNRRLVDFYRDMATINGKANNIGTYQLFFGDYKLLFDAPQKFSQVTAEDIKRVASQYLRKANRTVGVLSAQEDSNEKDL
jgi:zinc protease